MPRMDHLFTTAEDFAAIARSLSRECQRLGIVTPGFRAPTHQGLVRAIKHCPDGVVVLVSLGRDPHSVTSDLIDGCVRAQGPLDAVAEEMIRGALWVAAGEAIAA